MSVLKVSTNHSDYLIDTENKKFSRSIRHEHANPIVNLSTGEWKNYHTMSKPTLGEPMYICLEDSRWLRSTLVESVEEVQAAA